MINRIDTKSVKIIRLVSGEEICCVIPKEQIKDKTNLLRLSEPMLIKYVPQVTEFGISDYIALVKWVGFTDDKIITIPKDKIMTITKATKEMSTQYGIISKEYHTIRPPEKKQESYQRKEFTAEESRKIREIFEEFDDEDDGNKTIH